MTIEQERHGPRTELCPEFSTPGAAPTSWAEGRAALEAAEVYWISTVRADGRPHVTPLLAVWLDGALHLCTGAAEQKAVNLVTNPAVVLTTGCNQLRSGLDVVVEGTAVRVEDSARLLELADAWVAKYGSDWHFEVDGDAFRNDVGGRALVFTVAPTTAFGFRKGDYAQTRWRF